MKTLKRVVIEPIFVEFIPEVMEQNKLYISKEYRVMNHLCLCGCGMVCPIPLGNGEWTLIENTDNTVSFTPSLLHRHECKSHYIITKNVANFV